jgi:hypothetical protein
LHPREYIIALLSVDWIQQRTMNNRSKLFLNALIGSGAPEQARPFRTRGAESKTLNTNWNKKKKKNDDAFSKDFLTFSESNTA